MIQFSLMEKELYSSRETSKTAEGLLQFPPKVILVFDYQGAKEEEANAVMGLRAAVAASIYHSTLYDSKQKPLICCFAGEHEKNGKSGSSVVKKHLMELGVDEKDIDVRETTITTKFDIMQLHSLMRQPHHHKDRDISGPAAIITLGWHILRTEQEIVNHFNVHDPRHHGMPVFYVIGPFSKELGELKYAIDKTEVMTKVMQQIYEQKPLVPQSGGLTEEIAYMIACSPWLRKYIQPLAEKVTHLHTPKKLKRIMHLAGMRI